MLSFIRQECRDTWFHPRSGVGHPIDHLLTRPRDHRFVSAAKVLHEEPLAEPWSPYTDHNPIEVRLAKGWVFRAACRPIRRLKRPNWRVLKSSGERVQAARAALSAELDRRVAESEPTSWSEVVVSWYARHVAQVSSC